MIRYGSIFRFGIVNSGSPTTVSSNGLSILPNKSSLHGNSNNVNTNMISVKMTTPPTTTTTMTTTNKVVPNHGKPNCAPKPPGIQSIVTTKNNGLSPTNNVNSTTNNGNSNRPVVSRAHSMRSPRFVNSPLPILSTTHIARIASKIFKTKNALILDISAFCFRAQSAEASIAQ